MELLEIIIVAGVTSSLGLLLGGLWLWRSSSEDSSGAGASEVSREPEDKTELVPAPRPVGEDKTDFVPPPKPLEDKTDFVPPPKPLEGEDKTDIVAPPKPLEQEDPTEFVAPPKPLADDSESSDIYGNYRVGAGSGAGASPAVSVTELLDVSETGPQAGGASNES